MHEMSSGKHHSDDRLIINRDSAHVLHEIVIELIGQNDEAEEVAADGEQKHQSEAVVDAVDHLTGQHVLLTPVFQFDSDQGH